MFDQLRRILGVESINDKLSRLNELDYEINVIGLETEELVAEYVNRNEAKNNLIKSESIGEEAINSVKERMEIFKKEYIDTLFKLKHKKDKLEIEKSKLLKGDKINEAFNFLNSYNQLKQAYKSNILSPQGFDSFLKAKQGKIKYADNLVFSEDNKLLILKRSKNDKSQPEKWTLPGGHVDAGEDFMSAAKRELMEESGLIVTECKKVGEYSNKEVEIEYYRSTVNSQEQPVILQENEMEDHKWIDVYTEIDNYEFPFNMEDNIRTILDLPKNPIKVIKKAVEIGLLKPEVMDLIKGDKLIGQDKVAYVMREFKEGRLKDSHGKIVTDRKQAISIAMSEAGLSKGEESKEEKIIKGLNSGIIKESVFDILKSNGHKYIKRESDGKGGWKYFYQESEKKDINELNLSKIKEYANKIIGGEIALTRLQPEEEQGRLLGGKRNVEATLITGRSKKTSPGIEERLSPREQEQELKNYAQKEDLWVADVLKTSWGKNFLDSGGEQEVYYDRQSSSVYKVNHYPLEEEPLKFFDRIALHNFISPEAPYEVVGFTTKKVDDEDKFAVIIKQPFIKRGDRNVTFKEVEDEMVKRGFKEGGGVYTNDNLIIGDLHPGNVIRTEKGSLIIIDPMVEPNIKEAGYGGKRQLGGIDFNEDIIKKAVELGLLDSEVLDIIKDKSGVYADNPTNRRLKRVGQKYGSKKQEEQPADKNKKQEDGKEVKQTPEQLVESAKNSSQSALGAAIKESPDPDVRQAAHNELKRRQDEEHIQEEKFGDPKKEDEPKSKKEESPKTDSGKDEEKGLNSKKNLFPVSENKYSNGVINIVVGEENGSRVRGNISKDGKEFQIKSTFVNEDERGKGKAKQMYKELFNELNSRGINVVKSDVQVEAGAGGIYNSLKKEGYNVKQNKGAVLEKDPVGDFWWVPEDETQSPFTIILNKTESKKEDKEIEKSEENTILNRIKKWL